MQQVRRQGRSLLRRLCGNSCSAHHTWLTQRLHRLPLWASSLKARRQALGHLVMHPAYAYLLCLLCLLLLQQVLLLLLVRGLPLALVVWKDAVLPSSLRNLPGTLRRLVLR